MSAAVIKAYNVNINPALYDDDQPGAASPLHSSAALAAISQSNQPVSPEALDKAKATSVFFLNGAFASSIIAAASVALFVLKTLALGGATVLLTTSTPVGWALLGIAAFAVLGLAISLAVRHIVCTKAGIEPHTAKLLLVNTVIVTLGTGAYILGGMLSNIFLLILIATSALYPITAIGSLIQKGCDDEFNQKLKLEFDENQKFLDRLVCGNCRGDSAIQDQGSPAS